MTISADDLANLYVKALDDIGLTSRIDDDKDVIFKHPDLGTFYVSLDAADDPEFMRLVFPNFADQTLTGGDVPKLLSLINEVNRKNKAVKLYVRINADNEANISASIECFVAGPNKAPTLDHLKAIMKRCMSAMRAGIQTLVKDAQDGDSF
jgi:hypothetical protein